MQDFSQHSCQKTCPYGQSGIRRLSACIRYCGFRERGGIEMNELATLERLSQEGRSLLLNSQQEMIREVIDLCRNGYMIRFHLFWDNWWFIKLKHTDNGRELIAEWKPKMWLLREGKSELKRSVFPED